MEQEEPVLYELVKLREKRTDTNTRVLAVNDIQKVFEKKCKSPTVEKMLFIETYGRRLFPCYVKELINKADSLAVTGMILNVVQLVSGTYGTAEVRVAVEKMGTQYQIWNDIPSEADMNEHPLKKRTGGEHEQNVQPGTDRSGEGVSGQKMDKKSAGDER